MHSRNHGSAYLTMSVSSNDRDSSLAQRLVLIHFSDYMLWNNLTDL